MKFKYKKIILIITMCTMCIGMITISLSTPSNQKSNDSKDTKQLEHPFAELSEDATLIEEAGINTSNSQLKDSTNEEISHLVAVYMNSMLTCDFHQLEDVVTNVENIDTDEMLAKQKLIAEYKNTECYTMPGRGEGEYLVYVYSELKFTNIETAAPGLTRLYIVTTEDGLRIETGLIKQEVQDFIAEADESEDVQKIINTVNVKLEEAINKDSNLREFYAALNGGSDEVDTDAGTASASSSIPTDEPIEDTETVKE